MTDSPPVQILSTAPTLRTQAAARVAVLRTRAKTMRAIVALAESRQAAQEFQTALIERDGFDMTRGDAVYIDALESRLWRKDQARIAAAAAVRQAMNDLGATRLDAEELIVEAGIPGLHELLEVAAGPERIRRASEIEQAALEELERAENDLHRVGCSRAEDFALMQLIDAERAHELTRTALERAEAAKDAAFRAVLNAQVALDRVRLEVTPSPATDAEIRNELCAASRSAGAMGGADGDASTESGPGDQRAMSANRGIPDLPPETAAIGPASGPRIPETPTTESPTP